jgi:hypothetical protein
MERLRSLLSEIDVTVDAYFFLDGCQDLREAIHELLGDDPLLGYGFDMYWRSLYRYLGGPDATGELGIGGVENLSRITADQLLEKINRRGATHVVYMVGRDAVVRWTASGAGVQRDVISEDPRELSGMLTAVGRIIGTGAGTLGSNDLEDLSALSSVLLPESIRKAVPGARPPLLLVTADRFLEAFPFEALDLGEAGEYTPLLGGWNVAYLRYDGEVRSVSPGASGVIVADPSIPSDLRRRHPSLNPLPHTLAEAKSIQVVVPGSKLLVNSEATKHRLSSMWEKAGFLFIAAHFVTDPQTPYLTFIPLAEDPRVTDLGASFLDLTDVRRADLSRCGLVALSGCASGAPFSDTAVWGPGLGDAFLDAGAGAVIQTFWQVKDSRSRELMTEWAVRWAAGSPPVEALCDVRRAALAETGAQLPFSWAAYAIELGGL